VETGVDLRLVMVTGVDFLAIGVNFVVTGVDIAIVTGIGICAGDLEAAGSGSALGASSVTTLWNASATVVPRV